MTEIAIEAKGLTKDFGEGDVLVRAVQHVDLEVRRGEVVLIMGPSGSGKTTLLSMLGGMLRPTSGRISIDGVDLATLPESKLPEAGVQAEQAVRRGEAARGDRPCSGESAGRDPGRRADRQPGLQDWPRDRGGCSARPRPSRTGPW